MKYLVDDILVEATRSEGGGFYDLIVVPTGEKLRYVAQVFEAVAKPVLAEIHDEITVSECPEDSSFVDACDGCPICKPEIK